MHGHTVTYLFFNFCKPFDCVDHTTSLKKMSVYGVRRVALSWFQSYLTNRKQFLSVDSLTSECCPVDCGVSQGSILDPLLFHIFINYFPNSSTFFKFTLFADDSTLTFKLKNVSVSTISNTQQWTFKMFQTVKIKYIRR